MKYFLCSESFIDCFWFLMLSHLYCFSQVGYNCFQPGFLASLIKIRSQMRNSGRALLRPLL